MRAPWDTGVVWAKTPDGRPWFATTSQGYGCDLFWPCLDYPMGEPGVVTLHITVPKGLKAPSNGVLLGVDTLPDGRTRWNWRTKHPNTYAIALNVGPYEVVEGKYKSRFGNTIPMFYWYLPGEKKRPKGCSPSSRRRWISSNRRSAPSLRRRKAGRGRDTAQGHGAPDDQRVWQ